MDESKVVEAILKSPSPLSVAQLARQFRVKGPARREFRGLLRDLEQRGVVARVGGKSYTRPTGRSSAIIGRLEVTTRGFGFVRPDWSSLSGKPPFQGDLFIPPRSMGAALDGDLVRAEFLRKDEQGASGRIEEVIEHAHTSIVGRYQRTGGRTAVVTPRSQRIERRIEVPPVEASLGVADHDWVEVEITNFTDAPSDLKGRVISRLGVDGDRGIDVLLVLRDLGIVEEFPASVEKEVEGLRFDWDTDLKDRKDYRKLPTITIDPKTAKDFDDALSIEPIPGVGWRLYVHIADVAHFIKPGTALDNEAVERSTSVYPVDRVVPMLPTKISNYLCSLVPNEDRLTMTAIMEISTDGLLLRKEFHSSVIHSDYRLTYEQVQEAFDGHAPADAAFAHVVPLMNELRPVARALRKRRFARGALDLDIPELKILFDESGAASDIKFYPHFESHELVEECMLIANEAVAQILTEKEAPLLYRVHEVADQKRLEQLAPALGVFGIKLSGREDQITPKDIQRALEQAQKHPAGHILRRLVLRALRRAEYDPVNVGHFGLASECYCHFTSPIRRYPDVVVHRQLKSLEAKGPLAYPRDDNDLETLGEHTSSRERRAQEAEWEATAIKSLEFMKPRVGDEFDGYICGMQNQGIFVELVEFPIEGFVKKVSLRADRYELDDTGIRMVGKLSGHVLKLADKVRVTIDRIDPMARRLDLTLLEQPSTLMGRRAKKAVGGTPKPKPKGKGRRG